MKGRNMRRDSRVRLCIDEEGPPFHFVVIEGTSELTAGDPDLLYWATRIGGRYMGADRADEYGRRNAVEGEQLVRVTPQKIVAYKNISDLQRVLEGNPSKTRTCQHFSILASACQRSFHTRPGFVANDAVPYA